MGLAHHQPQVVHGEKTDMAKLPEAIIADQSAVASLIDVVSYVPMGYDGCMSKLFYVYAHRKASNGEIFYIGKGTSNRAWWFYGRSQRWNRTAKKYGVTVELLAENITEDDAFELEKQLIASIGRKQLCNHTDGGEGMSGWVASDKTRAKFSIIRKGRKHTDEAKRKMSEQRKGVPKSSKHIANIAAALKDRPKSKAHKRALSESHKKVIRNPEWGRKSGEARKKPVFCATNGQTYLGVRDAAASLGLNSCSVARVANGIYKHTKGYFFQYV